MDEFLTISFFTGYALGVIGFLAFLWFRYKKHDYAKTNIALYVFLAFVLIVAQDWTPPACDPQQQQKTYFDGCTKLEHIYVPWSDDDSIVNAYKVAYGWDTHAAKIVSLNEDGSIPE